MLVARNELLVREPLRFPVVGGIRFDILPGLALVPSEEISLRLFLRPPKRPGERREDKLGISRRAANLVTRPPGTELKGGWFFAL